jgi:hypothetical protein
MKAVILNSGSGSQTCDLFNVPDGDLPDQALEPEWSARLDATAPGQSADRLNFGAHGTPPSLDVERACRSPWQS